MSKFKLKWYDEKAVLLVQRHLKNNMQDAIDMLEGYIKQKLSLKDNLHGDNPSVAGEYPAAVSGQLRDSILTRLASNKKEVVGIVASKEGPSSKYAAWLEFKANRSFLRRGLEENKRKIKQILTRKMR